MNGGHSQSINAYDPFQYIVVPVQKNKKVYPDKFMSAYELIGYIFGIINDMFYLER